MAASQIGDKAAQQHAERLRAQIPCQRPAESGVPRALVSATTEKLLIPLPDRLRRAKSPVRPVIVGGSTAVGARAGAAGGLLGGGTAGEFRTAAPQRGGRGAPRAEPPGG